MEYYREIRSGQIIKPANEFLRNLYERQPNRYERLNNTSHSITNTEHGATAETVISVRKGSKKNKELRISEK